MHYQRQLVSSAREHTIDELDVGAVRVRQRNQIEQI